MADVTYTDLNQYVIVHMSKWVDPVSGKIHRVEYRARKYPPPAVDRYEVDTLEKWQDGRMVETLSARQLIERILKWTYAPEPAIDVQVWRELGPPTSTYDVLVQWKEKEGNDIHLVEIRKYHMQTFNWLMRDGACIYSTITRDMYELEEQKMNDWLKAKGDRKSGILDRIKNWKIFGKGENIRSLLVELEALGDDT